MYFLQTGLSFGAWTSYTGAETKIFKNCEHRIPTEGSSLGLQFIKKHFNL